MVAWEKILVWVLSLIVAIAIIIFLVSQMRTGGDGVIGTFLNMLDSTPKQPPTG